MAHESEIEIKLAIPAGDIAKVAGHPVLRPMKVGEPILRHFKTTYFDSPTLGLKAHCVSLRVRHDIRNHTIIQTLKMPKECGDSSPIAGRREWEWAITGDKPNMLLVQKAGIHKLLPENAFRRLDAVFTGDIKRTEIVLHPRGGGEVELAIDSGELLSGSLRAPVSEIELELKDGARAALYDIAIALCEAGLPLRLSTITKAERGFALFTGRNLAEPNMSPPPRVSGNPSAIEAFRFLASSCLSHFLGNYECALAGVDIEGVHQMRLALRRLRSVINFFRPILPWDDLCEIRAGLRRMTQVFGPERDLDVFIGTTLPKLSGSNRFPAIEEAAGKRQQAAHAATIATLQSPETTALLLKLCRFLDDDAWEKPAARRPFKTLAAKWLTQRHGQIMEAGENFAKLPEEKLHRLRISIKKLNMEIAATGEVFEGPRTADFAAATDALAKALGRHNDLCVAATILKAIMGRRKIPPHLAAQLKLHLADVRKGRAAKAWLAFQGAAAYW